jgi:hypothetical protein
MRNRRGSKIGERILERVVGIRILRLAFNGLEMRWRTSAGRGGVACGLLYLAPNRNAGRTQGDYDDEETGDNLMVAATTLVLVSGVSAQAEGRSSVPIQAAGAWLEPGTYRVEQLAVHLDRGIPV